MKKRVLTAILSVLTICVGGMIFGACGDKGQENTNSSISQQGSSWEQEEIADQEHGEIELPEVEIP